MTSVKDVDMPEALNVSSNNSSNLTTRFLTVSTQSKAAQLLQCTQLQERKDGEEEVKYTEILITRISKM